MLFLFFVLSFVLFLGIKQSFAADTCQGYPVDSNNNVTSNTVEKGICYYADTANPTYTTQWSIHCGFGVSCSPLPDCSKMTGSDYHNDPNYHVISDAVSQCRSTLGGEYKCCAPNDQSKTDIVPPPPCTDFAGNAGSSACKSVDTALGNIPTDPGGFIGAILGILLSLSGGIALILIIAAGYQLMTSGGNPEKVKEARERLTSAIVGLLLIIFSLLILQTLTVNILHIPGFNF